LGSGREIIDLEAAARYGVSVHFSPEGNAPAVGEHALALLLAAMRHVVRANKELREGIWRREENRGGEIQGKTVGIWGFGHTGRAFARLLSGFGCKILAYDKYAPVNAPAVAALPEQIFREADLVSIHLPLTEETRLLANRDFFNSFSKPIVFLNTARGEIVETEALLLALESGKVSAAGLDVFASEPPWKNADFLPAWRRLQALEQVVISPHIGGWTRESKQRMAEILLQRIAEQFSK
jgi:D-3-phosphoglycerate dehydrogenase